MKQSHLALIVGAGVVAVLAAFFLGRQMPADRAPDGADGQVVAGDAQGQATGPGRRQREAEEIRAVDLSDLPSDDWVEVYSPDEAWNGYNLALYDRRLPMIVDMNGRVVHHWPLVRVRERVQLTPEGHLLYIASDRSIQEVDWDGEKVWEYRSNNPKYWPHHDVRRLEDGQILAIFRNHPKSDEIVKIDPEDGIVWTWSALDHLIDDSSSEDKHAKNPNLQSVQVIPDHGRTDDKRFRPGNLLVAAHGMDLIFVVDHQSGEVVWRYDTDLGGPNDPTWIPDGLPGAGHILLVNHRRSDANRRSMVLEIDPFTDQIHRTYEDTFFSTPFKGGAQKLPNGNILVTSIKGWRSFEIDERDGLVWQWSVLYAQMATARYPYDYCPQLAALEPPSQVAVQASGGAPHVDRPLYSFATEGETREVVIDGESRQVLAEYPHCEKVALPSGSTVQLGYGYPFGTPGSSQAQAAVQVTVARPGSTAKAALFEGKIDPEDGELWNEVEFAVPDQYTATPLRMCVETTVGGDGSTLWSSDLRIRPGDSIQVKRQDLPKLERDVTGRKARGRQHAKEDDEARGKRGRRRQQETP